MAQTLTTRQFIEKAIIVHGSLFDYSLVNYINAYIKVNILFNNCKNYFLQMPYSHLRGNGCNICANKSKKLTTEQFIIDANLIHGENRYNYSQVSVYGNKNKIIIGCNVCNTWFEQTPNAHKRGNGCPKCKLINQSNNQRDTIKNFIHKANIKHNYEYDYSFSDYIDTYIKIIIIHKKCNFMFEQRPNNHLNGQGCPFCGISKLTNSQIKPLELFIEQAIAIYGNKYDYSKVIYKNTDTKVCIICNKCMLEFRQTPHNHLKNHGCPNCCFSISKPEIEWLDSLNILQEYRHKTLKINNRKFNVDAYNPITNTIYEFNGSYWHGDPRQYDSNDLNKKSKIKFGILYKNNIDREEIFRKANYNIIVMWEYDWKQINSGKI